MMMKLSAGFLCLLAMSLAMPLIQQPVFYQINRYKIDHSGVEDGYYITVFQQPPDGNGQDDSRDADINLSHMMKTMESILFPQYKEENEDQYTPSNQIDFEQPEENIINDPISSQIDVDDNLPKVETVDTEDNSKQQNEENVVFPKSIEDGSDPSLDAFINENNKEVDSDVPEQKYINYYPMETEDNTEQIFKNTEESYHDIRTQQDEAGIFQVIEGKSDKPEDPNEHISAVLQGNEEENVEKVYREDSISKSPANFEESLESSSTWSSITDYVTNDIEMSTSPSSNDMEESFTSHPDYGINLEDYPTYYNNGFDYYDFRNSQ